MLIYPRLGGGLTIADYQLNTICGRIVSDWRLDGSKLTMNVVIPPNATATVYVPAKDTAAVCENGKPVDQSAGVSFLRMENGRAAYAVGSGGYCSVVD